MLRSTIFCPAIVYLIASVALCQEVPKPGPEHQKLQELAGRWNAVMEMSGQKSKATAIYQPICGGMWVQSDFTGDLGGIPFQGHGLDGYNQQTKKYVGVWVDSMSSAPMMMEGDYDAKTGLLVMTGESLNPAGKPQKFKTTTEFKDKDHFVFSMYMVEADGKERLSFTIDYTRQK